MDFQSAMETFAEAWVVASAKGTFTYPPPPPPPPINGFQVGLFFNFYDTYIIIIIMCIYPPRTIILYY